MYLDTLSVAVVKDVGSYSACTNAVNHHLSSSAYLNFYWIRICTSLDVMKVGLFEAANDDDCNTVSLRRKMFHEALLQFFFLVRFLEVAACQF